MDDTRNATHRRTWDLIPWVLNGSASDAERREVEQHVAGCADCADELAFQRQLHAAMTASAAAPHDPSPALRRLWAHIDRADSPPNRHGKRPAREAAGTTRRSGWIRVLAAAVVVQAIGLAALVGVVSERPRAVDVAKADASQPAAATADYRTLSSPAAAASKAIIRLVPAPTLALGELHGVLARSGLQVVETSADAAILGLAPGAGESAPPAELLARLRREPGVLLAEPVGSAQAAGSTPAAALPMSEVPASPASARPASAGGR